MSSPRALTLGPFTGVARDSGDFRAVTGWSGWDDAPAIRSGISPRSSQAGAWDATGFHDARVVSIEGFVERGTHLDATLTRDTLSALRPGDVHELAISDGETTRHAEVRVTQGAVFQWLNNVAFRYTIQATAPDPVKYGPPLFTSTALSGSAGGSGLPFALAFPLDFGTAPGVTPGVVEVPNAGTETYWPRIRIDGPVPNPKVTVNETGDFVRLGFTLSASQWVDVDCGNRRVLLNGQSSITRYVTYSGNWLAIPPGGASMSITADAADPAAALSVFHYEGAWL